MYDTYVFDLYGTLVDIVTDEDDLRRWQVFSRLLCQRFHIDRDYRRLRKSYRRYCDDELETAEQDLVCSHRNGPAEIDILNVWSRIAMDQGIRLDQERSLAISRMFRSLTTKRLRLYDGAVEVLNTLRDRGKQVILLSNAQASFTWRELRLLGIQDSFDHVFLSSDHGVKKPSPDFYALLNGVCKGKAIMIGNDDQCDCWGAAQAGLDSCYIHTGQSPACAAPLPSNCKVINALADVLKLE